MYIKNTKTILFKFFYQTPPYYMRLVILESLEVSEKVLHTFSPICILKTPEQHYSNSSTKHLLIV